FSAFLWFAAGWLLLVYVPIAHWVWGGGFLARAGVLDFAGGTVVHLNAGIAGLVAACVLGKRHGYGSDNFAPQDLSLAVIGTGLMAGAICFWPCTWLKRRIGYDDSLDVFGVHGVGGATGTLLTGVFAVAALSVSPDSPGGSPGLLEGNARQVLVQLYPVAVTL